MTCDLMEHIQTQMKNLKTKSSAPQAAGASKSESRSPQFLYFAQRECWPPDTGQKLRNYYLARELARRAFVTYLGFSENGGRGGLRRGASVINAPGSSLAANVQSARPPANIEDFCQRVVNVPRGRGNTLLKIMRGAVGRKPLPALNYKTPVMTRQLEQLLEGQNFDLVQVESIHLAEYLPVIRAARRRPFTVCDWHNVESELMWRYSERAPTIAHRFYAKITARRLEEMELRMLRDFDAHTVVSERDRARLLELAPWAKVQVIENGVDTEYYSDPEIEQAYAAWRATEARSAHADGAGPGSGRRRRAVFVGSMDYYPNVEAVVRFAREIWPNVCERNPGLIFTIVGRNPAPAVLALTNIYGIEVTGTVPDVRPYYREAMASVVPLRMGAGSRLKILEAMAAGVPVVSTRLGAEGLEVKNGQNIILADTQDEIADALVGASTGDQRWRRLADAGREQARARYDWSAIGKKLFDLHVTSHVSSF
jgi:glycosyltransferase involved in cell wall biosynthesis